MSMQIIFFHFVWFNTFWNMICRIFSWTNLSSPFLLNEVLNDGFFFTNNFTWRNGFTILAKTISVYTHKKTWCVDIFKESVTFFTSFVNSTEPHIYELDIVTSFTYWILDLLHRRLNLIFPLLFKQRR